MPPVRRVFRRGVRSDAMAFSRKRRRFGARPRRMRYGGRQGPDRLSMGTIILNPKRMAATTTVTKTKYNCATATGVFGAGVTLNAIFDPSGTYDVAFGYGAGTTQMPDWGNYVNIFDKYKVNWIEIEININNLSTSISFGDVIWSRYNYSLTPPAACAGPNGMQELANIQADTLTADKQQLVYRLVPMVNSAVYNTGTFSAAGLEMARHTWTDVNRPCQLYGYVMGFPYGVAATTSMTISVTYNISFKEDS